MFTVYLACLIGGLVATVLFAALGALGGAAGHGVGHLHTAPGHGVHLPAALSHTGHTPASASANVSAPGHVLPTHVQHVQAASGQTASHGLGAQTAAAPGWLAVTFGWTLSWLSPLTLAAAALWFGGAGLIAQAPLHALALPLAAVAGVAGAAAVRAVMAAFVRASTPPLREGAVGALGTVNAAIRADASGEVVYTLEGLRRSAAARSVDGGPIPRGTSVVIVRRERGMAWVTPLDPLDALDHQLTQASSEPEGVTARGGDLSPPA